ncbi:hypothetical protein [Apis mellifera associated microvirus 10]|nr:hypothetical protein [Apis mellifera associated microvirus 10]
MSEKLLPEVRKFIFQMLDFNNGNRSDHFACSISDLRKQLEILKDDERSSTGILFVGLCSEEVPSEFFLQRVHTIPLLNVHSFLKADFNNLEH